MAFKSYLTVGLLCFINLLNYMDRFTIAGVLKDIQKYFDMSNATCGLLQTVFVCSYMIFAPVFGFIGDRYSRKIVIIGGVSFWSSVTLLSSFVQEHHTIWFFIFRGLVGIGEASYSTVAPTIIADLFFGKIRSTMIAFFYFAIPVGSGLGYIVGSQMAVAFGSWHWALRFTPFFGYLCAIIYCFVPEPKRGEIEESNNTPSNNTSSPNHVIENGDTMNGNETWRENVANLRKDIRYLFTIPTYIYTSLGFTCVCFSAGALSWWAPNFMAKAILTMSDDEVAFIFGIIACLGGILGVLIGSILSQTLRPNFPSVDPMICGFGVMLSIPFLVITLFTARDHPTLSWICIFISITLLSTNWSIIADILLYVIIPTRRSTAAAFQILVSHLLGDATSPFIVGLISNIISSNSKSNDDDYKSLSYALIATPVLLVFGSYFFLYAAKSVTRDELNCKNGSNGSDFSLSTGDCTPPPVIQENSPLVNSASNANLVQRC